MRHLDELSRSVFWSWAFCSTVLSMFVLVPWWVSGLPFNQIVDRSSTMFRFAALVTMLGAMHRREHVGKGPLNGWDQSIAFNGLAIMGHMLLSDVT